ncbi:hypothetical protein [Aureimonas phyllosphaerae]|uniref:Uncharacterized protein n=1 Tax=Aureimonas phyllosphaerae TaxID=1166078 RepID=A0A7W6BTF8_9HYPH|nr:hypothetical protein [Aureimonas phyllosphaerae]MBB3936577.1 hypothetical protein [Aureimonas phyllosphaerae]MBB3960559.1 hypothetical protein [Aureimonas phyllosphaerae]SFF24596.1 hypothetical protein SAMN05216566_105199 [Aureimonas phyllosphaerae]
MPKKKGVSLGGTKLKFEKPGSDGTVTQSRRLKTGTEAIAAIKVRCRAGTFEWRYGRFGNAQYHAGSAFARLWERAGIASTGSGIPRLANGDTQPRGGLMDGRVVAMDQLKAIGKKIGGPMQRRLVAYCVEDRTPKEIAASYNGHVTDRQMSDTLDVDLLELARVMKFAT